MGAFVLDVMPVNASFQRALWNDIVAQHPELWSGVRFCIMERSNFLLIDGNLNSNRYISEVLQPEVVPLLQRIPVANFQQDNARPHVAKSVQNFCSAQCIQLLPWLAYLLDMSPIEHVWNLVGPRLARDPRHEASKDELWLQIQAIWNIFFHKQTFKT